MKKLLSLALLFINSIAFSQITLTENHTAPTCYGLSNGSATITASGGTGAYTYTWIPTYASSPIITGIAAGIYTVFVEDAVSNTNSLVVAISQPSQLSIATTQTNVSCSTICDGTLNISPSGGTPPYFYYSSFGSTSSLNTNICAGNYSVFVQDSNNCSTTIFGSITTNPMVSLNISANIINANCGQSDGSICINVSGGTSPYTYNWDNSATSQCISNVSPGNYSITITDSNGCTKTQGYNVIGVSQETITFSNQINASCFGYQNGSITASLSGLNSPYSYFWLPSNQTTASAGNLAAGIHTVIVTGFDGCSATSTVLITQPQAITITSTVTNSSCLNNCNGSINTTVTGGNPGYNFSWIGPSIGSGQGTNNPTAMCPGIYNFVITDANGCVKSSSLSIGASTINTIPNTIITSNSYNETCHLSGDGSIDLIINGANTGPFSYLWNNGALTQDIINITSNIYNVQITDVNGNCFMIIDTVSSIGINCGTINGNVFIDNNNDCIKNSGDNNLPGVTIIANPGNRIGYSNVNGDYIISNLPYGTYTITSNTNSNMIATCSNTLISSINSGTINSINNNFSKEYLPLSQPDLYVSAYSMGIVPGFVCRMNYLLHNYNTFNANGLFKVTLPSAFIPNITNAFPSVYTLSGDTIIWNFTNINYMGYNVNFYVDFTTPLSTQLGSLFTSCMWAQPTVTDLNYVNNTYCYSRYVTGSFDPNDKTVSPVGTGANGDIPFITTDLTYLIRFQNTGNGPAVNIVVKDTLSPNVDVTTFEMLGSSHNYNIEILPGNILKWKFNNIMLPDSNSNEPASHGYIQYRVKRNPVYEPGTQIKNTAYIYFDFNEPVVTNTAINTIAYVTDIKSSSNINDGWNVYPNPSTGALYIVNSSSIKEASQVQVLNAIGQVVLEETITSNYKNIDLSKLNNGVYFVKISSENNSIVKRVVLRK